MNIRAVRMHAANAQAGKVRGTVTPMFKVIIAHVTVVDGDNKLIKRHRAFKVPLTATFGEMALALQYHPSLFENDNESVVKTTVSMVDTISFDPVWLIEPQHNERARRNDNTTTNRG